jgi:DNA replication protein DnaC
VQRVSLANLSNDLRAAACEALLALGDRLSPVVVAGRVGVGKSTLAAVVARSFPTWGWYGLDDLLTTMMTCRTEGSVQRWDSQGYAHHTTEQQLLRKVELVSILVLDDVGTRTLSQPQAEALRAILDARAGKPLLATTNCTTRELDESIGVRNRSRLLAGAVVQLAGPDRRAERALLGHPAPLPPPAPKGVSPIPPK